MALLEEIADERRLRAAQDSTSAVAALQRLRSRRGFEQARSAGLLARPEVVLAAAAEPRSSLAAAFLGPYAPGVLDWPRDTPPSILDIGTRLIGVSPATARHLALVEAVRRLYRQAAMAADRADKEAASGAPPSS